MDTERVLRVELNVAQLVVLNYSLPLRQRIAGLHNHVGLADARLTPKEHGAAGFVSDGDCLIGLGQFHGVAP